MPKVTAPEKTLGRDISKGTRPLPCDWNDVRMLTIQGAAVRLLLKDDREVVLEFESADEIGEFLKRTS